MYRYYCPVDDAITYFTDRVNKLIVISDYAKKTYKKHPALEKQLEKVLHPSVELEKRLNEALKTLEGDSEFFFKLDRTTTGTTHRLFNPAWLLFGSYAGLGDTRPTFKGLMQRLRKMSQYDRDILFVNYLHDLEVEEITEEFYYSITNENCGDLFGLLRECGLDQFSRSRLIDLYANFDEYIDRLEVTLAPAISVIEANDEIYHDAVLRSEEILTECGGVPGYMQQKHNYMMSEGGEHHAHLCVLMPNSVSVRDGVIENLDAFIGVNVNDLLALLYSGKDNQKISNMFKMLSDETRLEILHCICAKPMYGLEIAEAFSISAPTVSYHMRKLSMSGFTESYFESGRTYYRANRENIKEFIKSFDEFLSTDQNE